MCSAKRLVIDDQQFFVFKTGGHFCFVWIFSFKCVFFFAFKDVLDRLTTIGGSPPPLE